MEAGDWGRGDKNEDLPGDASDGCCYCSEVKAAGPEAGVGCLVAEDEHEAYYY